MLPPAALLVLRPRDGFSIRAEERRERRGDSASSPGGFDAASPMVGVYGTQSGKDVSFRK